MTATRTLYRKANVTAAEATTSIFKRFPNVELVSFKKKEANAEEAKAARAKEGDLVYEATIRVAEFPPEGGDDSSSDEGSEPKEEKKDKAPKEESGSDPDNDGDDDSSPEGDTDDDFAGKDEGGDDPFGAEPKKLSPEEQIIHLLTQLLHAVQGGGGMGHGPKPPHGGPEMGGDLPDIGAPGKGEELPPPPGGPGAGGPGGPGAGGPPLPPPVKEKAPIGAGAFAHVTGRTEVTMVREDSGEVSNKAIIAEAAEHAPAHRVSKIQRTGLAQIGDDLIDLAEAKLALVTLVSR